MKESRFREIYVLLYRLGLVFLFYQIARLLFWFFNRNLIKIESASEYFNIAYYGTAFDTTAILYINALFILFVKYNIPLLASIGDPPPKAIIQSGS